MYDFTSHSQYVATTKSPSTAFALGIDGMFKSVKSEDSMYLFKIHTNSKMIDAQKTLGEYSSLGEDEMSVVHFVRFDQIEGWFNIDVNYIHDAFDEKTQLRDELSSSINQKFNAAKYRSLKSSGGQPSLGGFPIGSRAWEERPWHKFENKKASSQL